MLNGKLERDAMIAAYVARQEWHSLPEDIKQNFRDKVREAWEYVDHIT